MENERLKVKVLTDNDKLFLRSKTPASLPDNPSDKRYSASQIKKKMYEGYMILFDWLRELAENVNTANANINEDLQQLFSFDAEILTVEQTEYVIPLEDR